MATYESDTFMNPQLNRDPKRDTRVWTHEIFNEWGAPGWIAIVSENPYGFEFWHQYGGMVCLHKRFQGNFLYSLCPAIHLTQLADIETAGEALSDQELAIIADILPGILNGAVTLDNRAPAQEALVPVKYMGARDAWLIWENSD